MILRILTAWFGLVILAIANGAFREAVLTPRLGTGWAHFASSVSLSALILASAWFTVPWIGVSSSSECWLTGSIWLAMTVLFEFGFGHFVVKKSWAELLADYDLLAGRIWIVVLAVVFLAPYLVARMRDLP